MGLYISEINALKPATEHRVTSSGFRGGCVRESSLSDPERNTQHHTAGVYHLSNIKFFYLSI